MLYKIGDIANNGVQPLKIVLIFFFFLMFGASLMVQLVKNLPVTQETGVQSLGREDPLEKEMATHSSSLAWRIPWTEELGRLQFMGPTESDINCANFTSSSLDLCSYCTNF